MRRLKNVSLLKLIVHQVNHLEQKMVISPTDKPVPDEVRQFLMSHIRKCSTLQRPRSAMFEDPPAAVALACRRILSRPSTFAKGSGTVANQLYESMGTNRSIDPGFLVVCLCKNDDDNYRFLALLKMDPHPIFRAATGKAVEIVHEGHALPDPHGHLQKFAFVREKNGCAVPEILLLDMQARTDEVANFFQKHFLRCYFCKDDTTRTKEFYTTVRNWVNQKLEQNQIDPQGASNLMKACDGALHSHQINVEEFARAHVTAPELIDDLLDYVAAKGLDPEFLVDREAARLLLRTKKIRLDKAEIKIKEVDLNDPEFFRVLPDPENPEMRIVQMRSKTYRIVS